MNDEKVVRKEAEEIYATLSCEEKMRLQNTDLEDNLYNLPYNINGYSIQLKKELIKIAHNDKTNYFEISMKEDEEHEKKMKEQRKEQHKHSTSENGWNEMYESEYRN